MSLLRCKHLLYEHAPWISPRLSLHKNSEHLKHHTNIYFMNSSGEMLTYTDIFSFLISIFAKHYVIHLWFSIDFFYFSIFWHFFWTKPPGRGGSTECWQCHDAGYLWAFFTVTRNVKARFCFVERYLDHWQLFLLKSLMLVVQFVPQVCEMSINDTFNGLLGQCW